MKKLNQLIVPVAFIIGWTMLLLLANSWSWIGCFVLIACLSALVAKRATAVEANDKENRA